MVGFSVWLTTGQAKALVDEGRLALADPIRRCDLTGSGQLQDYTSAVNEIADGLEAAS